MTTRQTRALLGATLGVVMFAPAAFAQTPPDFNDPMRPADPTQTDPPTPTDSTPTTETRIPDPMPAPEPEESTFVMSDRTTTTTHTGGTRDRLFAEYGFALSAGGGVSGFTSETARGATNDGGGWDVRAVIGTKLPVAAEFSYLGSAQSIKSLGVDDNALLVGNGLQADVRLNVIPNSTVQPFIYAGAAWRRYDLTNTNTNTSDVSGSDNVVEFPIGAGLAIRQGGLLFDARGEFRAATNEDLMPSLVSDGALVNDDQAALHRWGVNVNVGYEF